MLPDPYLERYHDSGRRPAFAFLATLDSSNRLAAAVARSYLDTDRDPPPLILVAGEQSAGRGRRGRPWISPAGLGIYTSLLLSLPDAEALARLPLRLPVALCEALEPLLGAACRIKWPNDLVVGGRKLGGVLIEALAGPRAVVAGYGLNVGQWEDELPAPGSTSIRLVAGAVPELPRLAVDLAVAVMDRLGAPRSAGAALDDYRRRSAHQPGDRLRCRVGDELLEGDFLGFDDHGRLRLASARGERLLSAADVIEEGAGAP